MMNLTHILLEIVGLGSLMILVLAGAWVLTRPRKLRVMAKKLPKRPEQTHAFVDGCVMAIVCVDIAAHAVLAIPLAIVCVVVFLVAE